MAKNKLKDAAVKIGSAIGKADGTAHHAIHKAANAALVAQKELVQLEKQVDAFRKQLKKSTQQLKNALR